MMPKILIFHEEEEFRIPYSELKAGEVFVHELNFETSEIYQKIEPVNDSVLTGPKVSNLSLRLWDGKVFTTTNSATCYRVKVTYQISR